MRRTLGVLTLSLTALPIFRVSAQGVDRTKPPALPAPPALKLPAVQTTMLPNGLMIAVVEMHKVPVVDVQLLLDAGAARDPSGVPGLATFTATMLQQGAGARSALDVADEAAFLGAQLGTTASFDGASASIHVPKRRLEAGLDLLADVVLRPSFADSEIARQRELRAAQLVQQRDEPVAVANIAFPAIVYGREHPYGHPLNGTDSATARLARERVTEFYRTYYRPNGARLLVVGDVTLAEVRRLAAARFGGWVVWGVVLSTVGAVLTAFELPRALVMNGPIGATCPDMSSTPADVLTAFAVAAVATGIATVASVVVEGWRRAADGATFVRLGVAIVVPYVALGAWLVPRLCDYS